MRTLGETVLERSPGSSVDDSVRVDFHQHLADDTAVRQFSQKPEPGHIEFAHSEKDLITERETARWSTIFETLKCTGGIYSAYRWAPDFMPPPPAPAGLLGWRKTAGVDRIVFGGPTRAEILKQMKAGYTASCMGGMVAGWTVSHLGDRLFFPREQYMEGAAAGDLAGLYMALIVPGWKQKTALVAATHLIGKSIDHWRQPNYLSGSKS